MKKDSQKPKKKKKEDREFFDDCAICQAMKNGKANTLEDLKRAFELAEEQGTGKIVDRNFFNKEEGNYSMAMRTADKDDLYYDAQDAINERDFKLAERFLIEAKNLDLDYVQTYIGFANLYGVSGNKQNMLENIKIAFEKTLKKFPKWPKEMNWLDLDNRAYLRAIQYQADVFVDDKKKEEAIELYRLLLRLNPDDNQGARYTLTGLYAGISGEEVNNMMDEGNKKQNWGKLQKLVQGQNKKHQFFREKLST